MIIAIDRTKKSSPLAIQLGVTPVVKIAVSDTVPSDLHSHSVPQADLSKKNIHFLKPSVNYTCITCFKIIKHAFCIYGLYDSRYKPWLFP